jgi:uncharacterized protein
MNNEILAQGLDQGEFDELDALLRPLLLSERGMDVTMLDGFLTAIVSGPETIAPSEWLPYVWHAESTGEAPFDSLETAERAVSLILRRMNEIIYDLEQGVVDPVYAETEDGRTIADTWCVGYANGMSLRAQAWSALESDDENAELILPIMILALPYLQADDDDAVSEAIDFDDAERREATELVPDAALAIYRYWLTRRTAPTPLRRGPKTSRNAACPCGSGKKYKKCCGAA